MRTLLSWRMLKLVRQPALLFWGFLIVPLLSVLLKFAMAASSMFAWASRCRRMSTSSCRPRKSLSVSGNSLGQLLYALGIASVFHLDYRYSTWRLMVPRHARSELYLAKLLLCLGWLGIGLGIVMFGDMALNLLLVLIKGQGGDGVTFSVSSFSILLASSGIAFLELLVLAAMVAGIVILFRSMIAAVLSAFLLAIGSTLLQLYSRIGCRAPSVAGVMPPRRLRDGVLGGGDPASAWLGLAVLPRVVRTSDGARPCHLFPDSNWPSNRWPVAAQTAESRPDGRAALRRLGRDTSSQASTTRNALARSSASFWTASWTFSKARTSIWRTRSRLMSNSAESSSSVTGSSASDGLRRYGVRGRSTPTWRASACCGRVSSSSCSINTPFLAVVVVHEPILPLTAFAFGGAQRGVQTRRRRRGGGSSR